MENIKKANIWKKIINFIKKIFDKKGELLISPPKKEIVNTPAKGIFNQYEVMSLQKAFEAGEIKEDDLAEEEKESLKKLYQKQIETLEINILLKKKELLRYKEKILEVKQKISFNSNE